MHHESILGKIKIEVNLHPSVMGMAGHGIPYAARFQGGHSHYQLTALHLAGKNVFADNSVIGFLQTAQFHLIFILNDDHAVFRCAFPLNQHGGVGCMRGSAV